MILGPIATGAGLLWLKPDQFRKILVSGIALVVCGCVLALAVLKNRLLFLTVVLTYHNGRLAGGSPATGLVAACSYSQR